jgi:preprotein translocase subunit SecB
MGDGVKAETRKLIKEVSASLRLDDIVLVNARFERPAPPPEDPEDDLQQQHKRSVRCSIENNDEASDEERLVNITVVLGVRLVRQSGKNEEPEAKTVVILIEAEYLAIYKITKNVTDKAIEVFAKFNAVHNVWPFWRHNVFDICQRAKLPILNVPLMAGVSED